ncbi:MAG: hypothetical protein ABIT16_06770 [Croceibacterium sp.]
MNEAPTSGQSAASVEQALQDEMARGDAVIADAGSILRRLLDHGDRALFSDAAIARVHGMLLDLAARLLAGDAAGREGTAISHPQQDQLALALADEPALLAHAHALALEGEMAERLQQRSGIDSAVSPLVAERAASDTPLAGVAGDLLASQARFLRHFRRMELPLNELPLELFEIAMRTLGSNVHAGTDYDETSSRLGLLARFVMSLDHGAHRALSIEQAGLAVFASALADASGQSRDRTVLSLSRSQFARLALALRAAGLDQAATARELRLIHPDQTLPHGFESVRSDFAAATLSGAAFEPAG